MIRQFVAIALGLAAAAPLVAQEHGAARLNQLVSGLTVTSRVLVVGMHPDDGDAQLMTWLSRARSIESAYLSITRGESAQNFAGGETGAVLGAVRTQELLAARRIDGGRQYFTSAYDFGIAKNAADAIKRWTREDVVGDIVTVIRSFRPHVIVVVFGDSVRDGNGQHQALGPLAREAYDAAADTARFPIARYGPAWEPAKLYRHGRGLTLDLTEFDPVSGRTFADIAVDSRAQLRSYGLLGSSLRTINSVQLRRSASRVNDSTPAENERSLFDGIDTSMARLDVEGAPEINAALARIVASADSARDALNLRHAEGIVPHLARASQAASVVRRAARWCGHPSPEAVMPTSPRLECDRHDVDLDASIDVLQRRIDEALLLASGITFEARADRDLFADADTIPVTLTVYNHGRSPVTLLDVSMQGAVPRSAAPIVVPPDSVARDYRMVTGLVNSHPWWIARRVHNMFEHGVGSIDGVERGAALPLQLARPGVAIPEEMRRESDVTVTLSIEGATIRRSLGPVIYRYSDAVVGAQDRPVSGAPAITLAFEQNLEWVIANKPINRPLRLSIKSFSERPQELKLNVVAPKGVRVDSIPDIIQLEAREQREVFLPLNGKLDTGRVALGAIANSRGGGRFTSGFQTVQYPYLRPIRAYRTSGVYLHSVDVTAPSSLQVVYVEGVPDGVGPALQQIGIATAVLTPDQLPAIDLSHVTSVVIGPGVYDGFPQLLTQSGRLREFARKGGTVVILQQTAMPSSALPYPIAVGRPIAEHVTTPNAPITVLAPASRLLTSPNAIRDRDWQAWLGERAVYVPSKVDARYTRILETHDEDEKPNENSLLVAPAGKGAYIYTTLTLPQQITAGVPGALRLFVNLISYSVAGTRTAR